MTLPRNTHHLIRWLATGLLLAALAGCQPGGSGLRPTVEEPDVRGCSTNYSVSGRSTNAHTCTLHAGHRARSSIRLYCGLGFRARVRRGTSAAVREYRCNRAVPKTTRARPGRTVTG